MTIGQSILATLCPRQCEPSELEQVLLHRYGSSAGDRDSDRALLFPGSQDQYAIRLVFGKDFTLKDAHAGPLLTDQDLKKLVDLIALGILTPGPSRIATWTLFSSRPVSGCFRRQDDFQILPVPPGAPRPDFLIADHPFLLQFRFQGSSVAMVEQSRRRQRGLELELLLAGLVANHVRSDRTTVHRWVIPPPVGSPPRIQSSILRQVGYYYEGLPGSSECFAALDDIPALKAIPPREYYVPVRDNRELDLPADFEDRIADYGQLSARARQKFLNACAWFQHSHTVFHVSQSASYLALVQAVEALMPPPEKGKACGECGKATGKGPTRQFKDFLASLAPSTETTLRELSEFYSIRSKLAHGKALLQFDRVGLAGPGLSAFEEWQTTSRLHHFVQVAIINWLRCGHHRGGEDV